jgi:hypothetical protein
MGIIGDFPERGVRIAVERSRLGGPPWVYRGEAATAGAVRYPITAVVGEDGQVRVETPKDGPADLEARVRLVLRAAWKHACADGRPPPLRLARWRP